MATVTTTNPKIFILLKDPAWDGLKPDKIHLFAKTYATDGSAQLISDVAYYNLDLMRKSTLYSEYYTYSYWTYIPLSGFADTYVTPDLTPTTDPKAWTDFRAWYEQTVTEWCIANGLSLKIERDKTRQYYIKFSITVTPAIAAS